MPENEDDYVKYRGKCKEMCESLISEDPSLTLVRGHYYDHHWGEQQHWWCVDKEGNIIDPTKDQFPSKGLGLYIPFDGICTCENCGREVKEEEAIICGPYPVCSDACAFRLVGL